MNDVTEYEIRKVHRKLAVQYHPNKNLNDTATDKSKEMNEANEVLRQFCNEPGSSQIVISKAQCLENYSHSH